MTSLIRALGAALYNLGSNPLRTLLSTLGVVIGVASLVAILALGDGLEQYSRSQIASTTDLQTLIVRPKTEFVEEGVRVLREKVMRFNDTDVEALGQALGDRAEVAPFLTGSARAAFPGSAERHAVLLAATTPAARNQLRDGLLSGRYLSQEDLTADSRVAVVPEAVGEWAGIPPETLPGRTIELDGTGYEIIGVEAGKRGGAVTLHVPLSERAREALERPDRATAIAIRAGRVEDLPPITTEVESWLTKRFGSTEPFLLVSNRVRAAQARKGMLVFKLVMGAIAGISLLVGGIGIMNILLASVFERTREIGIRKATGARQRDILLQFLAESVTITGVGSLLGVVLGLVGAFAITAGIRRISEAQVYAAFTWGSVLVAAAAALLVGLVFGTYPARRAAHLSPIDAIRHE